MLEKMEPEQWERWVNSEETKMFLAAINNYREQLKKDWADGAFDSTDPNTVFSLQCRLRGMLDVINQIEEVDYDSYNQWLRV